MNAWILVDKDGRMLRVHQDGIEIRLQVGGEEVLLGHSDRIDLARFLMSGVSDLEPVIEEMAKRDHLFEPLPVAEPMTVPKPAHVTDGHMMVGAPAKVVVAESHDLVLAPAAKERKRGRTVVVEDAPLPPPRAKNDKRVVVDHEPLLPVAALGAPVEPAAAVAPAEPAKALPMPHAAAPWSSLQAADALEDAAEDATAGP